MNQFIQFLLEICGIGVSLPGFFCKNIFFMASSLSGQVNPNPALWSVTRAAKMALYLARLGYPPVPQENSLLFFVFDQTCSNIDKTVSNISSRVNVPGQTGRAISFWGLFCTDHTALKSYCTFSQHIRLVPPKNNFRTRFEKEPTAFEVTLSTHQQLVHRRPQKTNTTHCWCRKRQLFSCCLQP